MVARRRSPGCGTNRNARGFARRSRAPVGRMHERSSLVLGGINHHIETWSGVHRAACTAHRRGEVSDIAFEREMACLRERGDELAASLGVLMEQQGDAVSVVAKLTPPASCADVVRLLRRPARIRRPSEPPRRARSSAKPRRCRARGASKTPNARSSPPSSSREGSRVSARRRGGRARARSDPDCRIRLRARGARPARRDEDRARGAPRSVRRRSGGSTPVGRGRPDTQHGSSRTRNLAFVEPISQAAADAHFARALLLNNVGVVYRAAGHEPRQ